MEQEIDTITGDFNKISKINSASLVNSSLSNLWGDFFRHFRQGKYLSANSDLDCIWTILGGEQDIENSPKESDYKKIEADLADSGLLSDALEVKGFGSINTKQLLLMNTHKKLLLKKSLFLRRLQNTQGKGTAYQDEDEGDFD